MSVASSWQVVNVAATFCEVWEGVAAIIAEMDVLAGFAELAVSAPLPYVRPNMLPSDAGEISLAGCRWVLLSPSHSQRGFCMDLPLSKRARPSLPVLQTVKARAFLTLCWLSKCQASSIAPFSPALLKTMSSSVVWGSYAGIPAWRRRTVWSS
jgi:hypothetical protein